MKPVVAADEATRRLQAIFPRTSFDPVMSSAQAGSAIAAFLYVDSVASDDDDATFWLRPSMLLWMTEEVRERASDEERLIWRAEAAKGKKQLKALLDTWGVSTDSSYADGSRETVRDETFRKWRENGAMRERVGLPKTSPMGRWALEPEFAELFSPDLVGEAFAAAANEWRELHLSPGMLIKVRFAEQAGKASHAIDVTLPGAGGVRSLEAGRASLIIKAVVEDWAATRLTTPYVVTISEPGDKVFVADAALLHYLGLSLNLSELLPDALLADVGREPTHFWFVEAVNTDGEINNERKAALLKWAEQHGIAAAQCSFLTAFASRIDGAAKKRLKDLAADTFAYFADEPGFELAWSSIEAAEDSD